MTALLLSLLIAGPLMGCAERPQAPIAQASVRDVPVDDPLRGVLLDLARLEVEGDLDQPVQFVVDRLRVEDGNWALFAGRFEQPDGRRIDLSRAYHHQAADTGPMDGPIVYALYSYNNGEWRVVYAVIGQTNAPYAAWAEDLPLPAGLIE